MHQILCDTCGKVWTEEDRKSLFLASPDGMVVFSIDAWPQFGWKGDMCNSCVRLAMRSAVLVDEQSMNKMRYEWKEERERRLNADEPTLPVLPPSLPEIKGNQS